MALRGRNRDQHLVLGTHVSGIIFTGFGVELFGHRIRWGKEEAGYHLLAIETVAA